MDWRITIKKDIVKGQFNTDYGVYVFHEIFYVLASNEKTYIHYMTFNDWDVAKKLVDRIEKFEGFTPEGKPNLWKLVADFRPVKVFKKDWKKLLAAQYR